ncbi:MAG: RecX family transcriptional regulator [Clostridia bacterium]|nr:RecX family transcriptional regulator [Clostridia bacterium]
MQYIEEFDKLKTKVLKYIMFKKRTEQEVRQKFREESVELLNDVIEELKELNYINDENYINRAVNEFQNLKNMSIKEIEYKLMTKGIKKDIINNYICKNKEELIDYELASAKNIFIKKQNLMEAEEIINYLKKKGYLEETIKIAKQDI